MNNTTKLCECGCGQPTKIASETHSRRGVFKGEPVRFLYNHHRRKARPEPPSPPNDQSRYIALTKGKFVLVDAIDFEWLNQYKWCAVGRKDRWYATRVTPLSSGNKRQVKMHRQILDAANNMQVDHRDGNGLNNRRQNLRLCTHSENQRNKGKQSNNKSGYKGVFWIKDRKSWRSHIGYNGKVEILGYFDNPRDAALAYDRAALELHGEFAKLNFQVVNDIDSIVGDK